MAAELTGNGTFFVATALVQFVFAGILFYTSNRSGINRLLGYLFLINGVIAAINALPEIWTTDEALSWVSARMEYSIAIVTNILIFYLAILYPRPTKFAKQNPRILLALVVILSLGYWFPLTMFPAWDPYAGLDPGTGGLLHKAFYKLLAGLAFPFLLVRWTLLLNSKLGPTEKNAFKFVFAAFAIRAIHTIGTWGINGFVQLLQGYPRLNPTAVGIVDYIGDIVPIFLQIGALLFVGIYLIKMRRSAPSDLERSINFILAFMLGGLALAAFDRLALVTPGASGRVLAINPLTNVDVLIIRPILIWAALVRHHFVGSSMSVKVESQTIAFFITAPTSFGLSLQLLSLDGSAPATDVLLALLIAAMSGTFVAIAFHGLMQRYGSNSLGVRQGDADYLAALEDLYRRGGQTSTERHALNRLAAKLAVSKERADELESLVKSFLTQVNEHSHWNVGDRVLGRYRIEEHLGEGGMGNAYRCFDELTETQVALKRRKSTNPTTMASIHQEAKALAALNHPNIVRLIRTETAESELILVTEYLSGGTLEQRLKGPKCKPDAMRKMARQLLSGLQAAHRHGVVHRDIKPSNILFDEHGTAKIADFGIARELNQNDTLVGSTAAATALLGSIRYVAPEQLAKGHVSRRSDLYSLGVMLLDCALSTGRGANLRTPMSPTERRQGLALLPREFRKTMKAITSPLPAERPKDATQAMVGLSL